MKKTHFLKTVNPHFQDVWDGNKKAEIRFNDRLFEVGDEVYLQEYDQYKDLFSGREVRCDITHILRDYPKLQEDYVMFSLSNVRQIEIATINII